MINLNSIDPITFNGVWHQVVKHCINNDIDLPIKDNKDETMISFINSLETSNPDQYNKIMDIIGLYLNE